MLMPIDKIIPKELWTYNNDRPNMAIGGMSPEHVIRENTNF